MTEAVNEENSLWQNPKFLAYMGSTTFFNAGFSMQQLIISWLLVGVMLAFTIAFVPMLMTGGRVRRREGAVLLLGYLTFSWFVYFQ